MLQFARKFTYHEIYMSLTTEFSPRMQSTYYTIEEEGIPRKKQISVTDWTGRQILVYHSQEVSKEWGARCYEARVSIPGSGTYACVYPRPRYIVDFKHKTPHRVIFTGSQSFEAMHDIRYDNRYIKLVEKHKGDNSVYYIDTKTSDQFCRVYDHQPRELTYSAAVTRIRLLFEKVHELQLNPTDVTLYNTHGIVALGQKTASNGSKEYVLCSMNPGQETVQVRTSKELEVFEYQSDWYIQTTDRKIVVELLTFKSGREKFINGSEAEEFGWAE